MYKLERIEKRLFRGRAKHNVERNIKKNGEGGRSYRVGEDFCFAENLFSTREKLKYIWNSLVKIILVILETLFIIL